MNFIYSNLGVERLTASRAFKIIYDLVERWPLCSLSGFAKRCVHQLVRALRTNYDVSIGDVGGSGLNEQLANRLSMRSVERNRHTAHHTLNAGGGIG